MRPYLYLSVSLAVAAFCFAGCRTDNPGASTTNSSDAILPGPQADGSILLPNQWSLRPAGTQIVLGDFPVNIAIHPEGRFAAILHCGYGQHEIGIVDLSLAKLAARVSIDEAFYGLCFSRDGAQLYCSGASGEVIHQFQFDQGHLWKHQTIQLQDPKLRGIPAGLAVSEDSGQLYAANLWNHRLVRVQLGPDPIATELILSTNSFARVESAPLPRTEDEAAILKREEALRDPTGANDAFPYGVVLDEKRRRLYASLWAQAAVAVIDLEAWKELERWPAQEHPNEMALTRDGRHLFVANANRNTVSILDTATGKVVETLRAELRPNSPPGSTPNSLALSPDQSTLFVANANINAVAVFDVHQPGRSRSLGFIPVGWYPTSVRVTPDGKQLLVANGKGILPKANRYGPRPGMDPPSSVREYIGGLFRGTLSLIPLPQGPKFTDQMKRHTALVYRCSPALPPSEPTPDPRKAHPIPRRPGDPTPIHYCIYIIKENRTYDQILGDLPEGNGDPSLCLFPEHVTPNHHKLAREFVLLDNFYVESEVSADGHEWTMGAYATDFVEKTWPLSYGHNQRSKYVYPSEGRFAIAAPAGGYLWDRAREAGVSYRSYGEFIDNGKTTEDPGASRVPALEGHFDPWFRGFDMDYPDVKRAARFIAELHRFEREGEMPRLQIVRLPSDHTAGASRGKLTPTAHVADNDLAFGQVIEALTHSKFWPRLAIFVVEDDAQNGSDHVDAHRTVAYAISPYARRGAVDSTLYSTSSMLRTIELILGLKPMSQFDAAAQPMSNSFQDKCDVRPYKAEPARVSLEERNGQTAWGHDLSEGMDFTKEDAADDLLLNEIVWRSVRGPKHPMPAPVRAGFVFGHSEEDEEDED